MKYALSFAGGFGFVMFLHWLAGNEFVRGGAMASSTVAGVLVGGAATFWLALIHPALRSEK